MPGVRVLHADIAELLAQVAAVCTILAGFPLLARECFLGLFRLLHEGAADVLVALFGVLHAGFGDAVEYAARLLQLVVALLAAGLDGGKPRFQVVVTQSIRLAAHLQQRLPRFVASFATVARVVRRGLRAALALNSVVVIVVYVVRVLVGEAARLAAVDVAGGVAVAGAVAGAEPVEWNTLAPHGPRAHRGVHGGVLVFVLDPPIVALRLVV
ncbi:uncharacterized protein BcabD6B2_54600 [Babesia caballi]|uniref:Secreted protein n=1 Tax=Babesia caballi TaxID=5871 RepID=A0AAV4M103_BABCB|nr:hypothetical protein, conserved [Babesia caballi]